MLLNEIDKTKPIHLIGIGGTSMSGIAEIVLNMGYKVTGSDRTLSSTTEKLSANGIKIFDGHYASNVEGASLVIYTAAIKQDNPELVRAHELGITTLERADFLGELTKLYNKTICVSGTHGKTTTTSMISLAFVEDDKDPSVQVGAELRGLNNENYRVGKSDYFVIESCEYVRSFLKFHPQTAIVLNIEEDHLDYYKDLEDIKSAFKDFVDLLPQDGFAIYNLDDSDCVDVCKNVKCNKISFGIKNSNADFRAENISTNNDGIYTYDVCYADQKHHVTLGTHGYHNIYNSLACIATAVSHGLNIENVIKALQNFTGASRRFEYVGEYNGAKIYDDYAHHPTEIKATLEAASKMPHKRIVAIFQPHTYTRTKALFDEFSDAFTDADELILLDIYAAREKDTLGISSKMLVDKINEKYGNAKYIPTLEEATEYLKTDIKDGDILMTVGAGTVTKIGYMILGK